MRLFLPSGSLEKNIPELERPHVRLSEGKRPVTLADGDVLHFGGLLRRLQLHNDRAQTVVAAANGHARLSDPVAIIEFFLSRAMGQRKHILINGLPCFIAEALRLRIVRIKDLSLLHHGTGRQSNRAVFVRKFLVKRCFEDGNLHFIHSKEPPFRSIMCAQYITADLLFLSPDFALPSVPPTPLAWSCVLPYYKKGPGGNDSPGPVSCFWITRCPEPSWRRPP